MTRRNAMPSQSRGTRENQKNLYDQRILERRADLEKKGINPKEFDKDKVYKHLKAKRRAIVKAIAAIDIIHTSNERRQEAAEEPSAPAPKDKKPKKEKAGKAAPAKTGD